MSRKTIKQSLQYGLSMLIALAVLWYVLRDVQLEEMLDSLTDVKYSYILLSLFFALIGYLLRAWRWNLMLAPMGYRPGFARTLMALMIGYLANLALPRLGEVARCGVLNKSSGVPVSTSLGTVVAERAIDLVFLLLIVALALILEIDRLEGFLAEMFAGGGELPSATIWGWLLATLLLMGALGWWIFQTYKHRLEENALYQKVIQFSRDLLAGIMSVRRVEQPFGFWIASVLIWVMYYMMTYVIVFSLPQTAGIDLMAGLSILAMGAIGMAAPVQGGLGTYHLLVSGVLMVYGASKNSAVLLAFILHTSQTIFVVLLGALAVLGIFLISRRERASKIAEHEKAGNKY